MSPLSHGLLPRCPQLRRAVGFAVAAAAMAIGACWAQTALQPSTTGADKQSLVKPDAKISGAANTDAARAGVKPVWVELTAVQHRALKPLAETWNGISQIQRRKWLAISRNFESLSSAEQTKLHAEMSEWASLSAIERSQARLNFAETKKLSSDEKQAKWQAYQALSAEERLKLAEDAPRKLMGAATAVKPATRQRLTIPMQIQNQSNAPKIATAPHQVDQNTLLPQVVGSEIGIAPASSQ